MSNVVINNVVINKEKVLTDLHTAQTILRDLGETENVRMDSELKDRIDYVRDIVIKAHAYVNNIVNNSKTL